MGALQWPPDRRSVRETRRRLIMATLFIQLSLVTGSVAMIWLAAKKVQQARRIYNFHEEV